MLTPCIGCWVMPLTCAGSRIPAASSTVGATSMTWQNWWRTPSFAAIPLGQCTMVPLQQPPEVVVGVLEETCVVLHLPAQHRLERLVHLVPGRDVVVPRGQLGAGRDHPEFLLPGEHPLPQRVPAVVELPRVPVRPLLRH